MVLVPLSGFSYLNRNILKDLQVTYDVLVPLSGFSYLNLMKEFQELEEEKRSRPLIGVLLSQSCPLHLPKHKAFIPHLRGKPANERNLNIKLDHTDHKA